MVVGGGGDYESIRKTQSGSMLGAQGSGQHGNLRVERNDSYGEEIENSSDAVPSITQPLFADGAHEHLGKG